MNFAELENVEVPCTKTVSSLWLLSWLSRTSVSNLWKYKFNYTLHSAAFGDVFCTSTSTEFPESTCMKKSNVSIVSSGSCVVSSRMVLMITGRSMMQESNWDSRQKHIICNDQVASLAVVRVELHTLSVWLGKALRAIIARWATVGFGSCKEVTKW